MKILRVVDLMGLFGVSRSTVWRWSNAPDFPRKLRLGENTVAWFASEVLEWMESRTVPPTWSGLLRLREETSKDGPSVSAAGGRHINE
jgi:prophage regulatory protein